MSARKGQCPGHCFCVESVGVELGGVVESQPLQPVVVLLVGGIWGYAELVEVLNDPADREHNDRLEWLGLDDAAEFDPDRFDAEAVTRALSFAR